MRSLYTISKEFHFSASHQLTHLLEEQPDHQCARLHGHNYVVRLYLSADAINFNGFVVDYGELAWFAELLQREFDHRHLNDVMGQSIMTTAENLAQHFFHLTKSWVDDHTITIEGESYPSGIRDHVWCSGVEVCETPKTCSRYYES